MKFLQNPILRAIAAIVVGVLLLKFSSAVLHGLTVAFGIMFLVMGIIALLGWINERRKKVDYHIYDANGKEVKESQPMFPIAGLGSLILGVMMIVDSQHFIIWMMCLLSAVLILGALNECMNLWSARKYAKVHGGLWLIPLLIIGGAVFVICKGLVPPEEIEQLTIIILAASALLFAVAEVVFFFMFYGKKKAWDKEKEQKAQEVIEPADAIVVSD